jgi:flagellar biosynthesis protein FlhF
MVHMVTQFSCLGPSRLLFTGLDEAQAPGAIVQALIRSGLPATFVGTGQDIPDDMEDANAVLMATRACGENWHAAAAA